MPAFVLMYGPLLVVVGLAAIVGLTQALHGLKYRSIPHEYLDDHIRKREPDMHGFGTFCLMTLFALAAGYFGSGRPFVLDPLAQKEFVDTLLVIATIAVYVVLAARLALRNWRYTGAIALRYAAQKVRRAEKAEEDRRKAGEQSPVAPSSSETAAAPVLASRPTAPATPVAATRPLAERSTRPLRRAPIRRQTRAPSLAKV